METKSTQEPETNSPPSPTTSTGPSTLRRVLYGVLIVFFLAFALLIYTIVSGLNRANEAIVQPFGDFVQQLSVPATAVILPDPITIVGQINDISRLETVTYEFEKIVTSQRVQELLGVQIELETMIFVGYGTVVAGVDFSEMTTADLQVVDPNTVMVYLPPAKIFDDLPVLDTERSYVADRDTMFLIQADPELETQMRQTAEQEIREAAQASDMLERANANAQAYMLSFLNGVGFDNVLFLDDVPPTPQPYEQDLPKGFVLVTPTPTAVP